MVESLDCLTLLVVDDEDGPRQALRVIFEHDFRILLASSGEEALELVQHEKVHVAALDILLRGMSGVELLRRLKQHDEAIEAVMITGFQSLESTRQALRHGACDYLYKPFELPELRAAIARAANRSVAASELRRGAGELHELQHELREQQLKMEMARSKGEIYASVLHDLNNPLTVISGYIELIYGSMQRARRLEGPQLESVRADLGSMTEQVQRCFEISRRYLSFLRESPRGRANCTGVQEILAALKDLLLRHPAAYEHQLLVNDGRLAAKAAINGTDLLQILLNLSLNALQASGQPHQVTIEAGVLAARFPVEVCQDSSTQRFLNRLGFKNQPPLVEIVIRDTGGGVPPELVAKMFEESFTTKAPGSGTGLGLFIVKRLLQEAEAGLHFQTEPAAEALSPSCCNLAPRELRWWECPCLHDPAAWRLTRPATHP